MDLLIAALISAFVTLSAAGITYLTARRMGKLGLGPAQQKLNEVLKALNEAYGDRIKNLEETAATRAREITRLEGVVNTLRRERREMKQDIDDLRDEIRQLRTEGKDKKATEDS